MARGGSSSIRDRGGSGRLAVEKFEKGTKKDNDIQE